MDMKKNAGKKRLLSRRTTWVATGIAGVAAVGLIVATMGRAMPTAERGSLWLDTAQRGDMQRDIRASGTLVPKDIRWVTAGTDGTVEQVLVQAGARVSAATPLMRLANPTVAANLASAKATLEGAKADVASKRTELQSQLLDQKATLASAESAYEIAKIKNEANRTALASGALSQVELNQSQITLDQDEHLRDIQRQRVAGFARNIQSQMAAIVAKQNEAESALEIAQQASDSLSVTAGIDGILQQVPVEPGQRVAAGANLARVAQPDHLVARLQVSEVQAKDLALDLPVSVDTHNGIAEGKVSRVDPAVKNGGVTVDVTLTGVLPPGARPDLSVEGRVVLAKVHDVVSIARPSMASPNGQSTLFVLKAGSDVAHRVTVTYGQGSSDRIAVARGVTPGDEVILSDTSQWNAFDALRVKQ